MTITLTDGGIETRIIYEFKYSIDDFKSFELLEDESGRDILRQIYQSYADVGVRCGLPIQLGTTTWRASRKWTNDRMCWRRCCTRTARCLTELRSPKRSRLSMLEFPRTAALHYRLPLSHARAIGTASAACRTTGYRLARSRIEGERITSLSQRTR